MASRLLSLLGDGTTAALLAAAGGLGLLAWRAHCRKPAAAAQQSAVLPRLAPVDGLRAISSLSLVALHTAMIATALAHGC